MPNQKTCKAPEDGVKKVSLMTVGDIKVYGRKFGVQNNSFMVLKIIKQRFTVFFHHIMVAVKHIQPVGMVKATPL